MISCATWPIFSLKFYLKCRLCVCVFERKRERENSSIHCFYPPNWVLLSTAIHPNGPELSQTETCSQELKLDLLCVCDRDPSNWATTSSLPKCTLAGSWVWSGTQNRHINITLICPKRWLYVMPHDTLGPSCWNTVNQARRKLILICGQIQICSQVLN